MPTGWTDELAERRARNDATMRKRLDEDPHPMQFHNALRAVRDVLQDHPEVYLVNEGANALDVARNVIDMQLPRHRLDSGTWGVMGIGMGYAIAAAVETGHPVVAVEGDSAFGFSGMEFETICRYRLPVIVVILNNGGVYRGDEAFGVEGTGDHRLRTRPCRRRGERTPGQPQPEKRCRRRVIVSADR